MTADEVCMLAEYLRADDGSLSAADLDFSRGVADQIAALIEAVRPTT